MNDSTKPTAWQKAWTVLSALALAAIVLGNFISKVQPASGSPQPVAASGPMDCNNYRDIDTAALYGFALEAQSPTGACSAYDCGTGYEWWGRMELPAGTWRIKVKPDRLVCASLLTACDSICQAAATDQPFQFDFKTDAPRAYWLHFSAAVAVPLSFEVGRYELGPEECKPVYWGPPCPPGDRRR